MNAIMTSRYAHRFRLMCAIVAAPLVLVPIILYIGALELMDRIGNSLSERHHTRKRKDRLPK